MPRKQTDRWAVLRRSRPQPQIWSRVEMRFATLHHMTQPIQERGRLLSDFGPPTKHSRLVHHRCRYASRTGGLSFAIEVFARGQRPGRSGTFPAGFRYGRQAPLVSSAAGPLCDLAAGALAVASEARRRFIWSISHCCGSKSPPRHSSSSLWRSRFRCVMASRHSS
jgi:hypothetical protein